MKNNLMLFLGAGGRSNGGRTGLGAGGWGAGVDWGAAHKSERRCCLTVSMIKAAVENGKGDRTHYRLIGCAKKNDIIQQK